ERRIRELMRWFGLVDKTHTEAIIALNVYRRTLPTGKGIERFTVTSPALEWGWLRLLRMIGEVEKVAIADTLDGLAEYVSVPIFDLMNQSVAMWREIVLKPHPKFAEPTLLADFEREITAVADNLKDALAGVVLLLDGESKRQFINDAAIPPGLPGAPRKW